MQNIGTLVAIILIVVLLVVLFGGIGMLGWGGFGMGGMMGNMGGMMSNFGGFFSPLGAILMLVFWALIIAGGVLLVVWLGCVAWQVPHPPLAPRPAPRRWMS